VGWLQRLFGSGQKTNTDGDRHGYYVYVRCKRCKEKIKVRVNLANDLAEQLSEDNSDRIVGYTAEKGIVGNNFMCGQTMRLYLTFDTARRPTDQRVEGGAIISAEEFTSTE